MKNEWWRSVELEATYEVTVEEDNVKSMGQPTCSRLSQFSRVDYAITVVLLCEVHKFGKVGQFLFKERGVNCNIHQKLLF